MKHVLCSIFVVLLSAGLSFGQSKVTGKVTDSSGEPLIGASVVVKEVPTVGTITDIDGMYELVIPAGGLNLVFSYTGYETKEMGLGSSKILNVILSEGKLLEEVVVTALGVSRSDKSIGYSVQKVSSSEILKSGAMNPIDALAGQVAGLQVTSASGSAGAATRMVLRGTTTLNGNNEALLVVDGVRVNNSELHSERSLAGVANSNRGIDINPADIESISVLKGASASALYGVDAANGVILITTKKGRKKDGISVDYSADVSFSQANRFPKLQQKFAQGTSGIYSPPNGAAPLRSWGPNLDTLYWNGDANYAFDKNGAIIGESRATSGMKKVSPYDNYAKIFRTGVSQNHNLSVSGGSDLLSFRVGAGISNNNGIVQNNEFNRINLSVGTTSSFLNKKLTITTYANYINSGGIRIQQGSNTSGLMLGLTRSPITFDNSNGLDEPWNAEDPSAYQLANGNQRNYANGAGFDNPFWVVNNTPFEDKVNRLMGNLGITYKFNDWFSLGTTVGTDLYSDNRSQSFEIGSRTVPGGRVIEDNYIFNNIDAYVQASGGGDLTNKISLNYLIGTNIFNESIKQNYLQGDGLAFRNYRNIRNTSNVSGFTSITESKRVGFFGSLEMGYDRWIYLTLTGRQDYLSNLIVPGKPFAAGDISIFYPSASLGFVFTEKLKPNFLDYGKVRLSFAQVGGGAPAAYLTSTNFVNPSLNQGTVNDFNDGWTNGIGFPFLGQTGFTLDAVRGAFDLRPSLTTEYEAGLDLRFLNNKLKLDVTGYSRQSTDQILVVPVAGSSGFQRAVLNSGALSTTGIDVMFGYDLINKEKMGLTVNANFGTWRTYVEELAEGVANQYIDGFTGSSVYNIAPEKDANGKVIKKYEYGQIFGGAWLRTNDVVNGQHVFNPDKAYNPDGKLIINSDPSSAGYGYPIADPTNRVIGNPNPDFIMGFGADFRVQKLNFTSQFEWRQGGQMWNGTKGALVNYGMAKATEERGSSIVFPGVAGSLIDGQYVVTSQENNINATLSQAWYQGNGGGFGAVSEHFIEDASSLRIRTLGLSYNFGGLVGKSVKDLTLGFSAHNILLWSPYDGIDPNSSLVGSSSNGQGLEYFNNPAAQTYMIRLSASF
jgi:TonB-linked SusC/RagA family outer membrane protein